MSENEEKYSIGDLAREFDLTTRTIRFYEDKKLLNPARNGQTRVYSRADRTRLKLVLRGKRLGWKLDEIVEIIQLYSIGPDGEKKQLEMMLRKIKDDRESLFERQRDIESALVELDAIEKRAQKQLKALID